MEDPPLVNTLSPARHVRVSETTLLLFGPSDFHK